MKFFIALLRYSEFFKKGGLLKRLSLYWKKLSKTIKKKPFSYILKASAAKICSTQYSKKAAWRQMEFCLFCPILLHKSSMKTPLSMPGGEIKMPNKSLKKYCPIWWNQEKDKIYSLYTTDTDGQKEQHNF